MLVVYLIFTLLNSCFLVCSFDSFCELCLQDASSIQCSKCQGGYYLHPINLGCQSKRSLILEIDLFLACQELPNCLECSDQNTCTECSSSNFQVSNGVCRGKKNVQFSKS